MSDTSKPTAGASSQDQLVRPSTYGQQFIRGLLPGSVRFDEPRWWKHPAETVDSMLNELEAAWGIIANAGGGDWNNESAEWRDAASKWRDKYRTLFCSKPNQPSWVCSVCGWIGMELSIGEAPELHRQWNSTQGMYCPGNLSPNSGMNDSKSH